MFRAFKKAYEDEIKGHGLFFFLCLFLLKLLVHCAREEKAEFISNQQRLCIHNAVKQKPGANFKREKETCQGNGGCITSTPSVIEDRNSTNLSMKYNLLVNLIWQLRNWLTLDELRSRDPNKSYLSLHLLIQLFLATGLFLSYCRQVL